MIQVPWFEIFIGSYVVWVVVACTSLLMSRRSPTSTLAWMFAFIALPVVSGLYYLVFGPHRLQRRRRRYGIARGRLAGGTRQIDHAPVAARPKLTGDAAALAAVARRLGQGEPTFASAVKLLDDGDQKMQALEEAIVAATHHIHMEYYIWEPDRVGTHFRNLLAAAAGRGVKVRVLYDAVGSPHMNRKFWAPVTDLGGEVAIFNRLHLSFASLHFANFRTHRKIALCDGRVGFLGGINLHDPESSTRSGKDAWKDAHARIDGEPVWRLQQLFLENWSYSGREFHAKGRELEKYFPLSAQNGQGLPVQVIASGPDDENAPIHAFFLAAISTARKRIWIETPYLIPDEPLESAMRIAELRGVDVQVIVPKQGDSRLVTAASHTYCESMRKAGVAIHEYGPPMLHAKTMVIDDTVAVVGTANMDNRSFRLNFEVAAAFYDPDVIARLAKRFADDRALSKPFPARRRSAKLQAFLESVARLTSPVL
jgi:cardiolipin synthase